MLNDNEVKKLDMYFTGKYLIDEEKDLELKKILREVIEERNKLKKMVINTPNNMVLGEELRSHFNK